MRIKVQRAEHCVANPPLHFTAFSLNNLSSEYTQSARFCGSKDPILTLYLNSISDL